MARSAQISNSTRASSVRDTLIVAPGQGIVTRRGLDKLNVPPRAWSDGRNVRFTDNGTKVRKTDGYTVFDTTTGNIPIRALWAYAPLTGTRVLVRIGTTTAYSQYGTGITSIKTGMTGGVDDVVSVDQYQDSLIWTDRKDFPQLWTGTGSAAALTNAPKAKIVVIHANHALLFNVINPSTLAEQPWRMSYSALGALTDYTSATAGDLDFLETPGPIVAAAVQGGTDVLVYKDYFIHRASYVGSPYNYVEQPIPSSDGAISARAVVAKGPFHYVMGNKDFWRVGAYPEPIGTKFVQYIVDTYLDRGRKHLVFAYERAAYDEIVWKIPTPMDTTGAPYFDIVYNTRDGTWSFNDHAPGYSFCFIQLAVIDDWDTGEDAFWDAGLDVEWDWSASYGNAVELLGQANGKLQSFGGGSVDADGVAIAAYLESGYFASGGLVPSRLLRIPIIGKGTGSLLVKTRSLLDEREDATAAWNAGDSFPLGSYLGRPWALARGTGRLHQVRLEQSALGADFELDAYGFGVIPGEEVR